MILYTSNDTNNLQQETQNYSPKVALFYYLGISIFCTILFLIYNQFAHQVYSNYMTYLFAWPICLGVIPTVSFMVLVNLPRPNAIVLHLYREGVACMTVSSFLRGALELAGTSSIYQMILMFVGVGLSIAAVIVYVVFRLLYRPNKMHEIENASKR